MRFLRLHTLMAAGWVKIFGSATEPSRMASCFSVRGCYSFFRFSSFTLSKWVSVETMKSAFSAIAVAAWMASLGAKWQSLMICRAEETNCLSAGMISKLGKFNNASHAVKASSRLCFFIAQNTSSKVNAEVSAFSSPCWIFWSSDLAFSPSSSVFTVA